MAEKFIDGKILSKFYTGEPLTEAEWDEYMNWMAPEEDDEIDKEALKKAEESVEGKVFGMYGNIAKRYCLEDYPEKGARIGSDLAEYLREIDEAAQEMRDVLTEQYLQDERFKSTGNYMEDVKRKNSMNKLIHDEITHSLIYVE